MYRKIAIFLVFLVVISTNLMSQEKGNNGIPLPSDTSMVFESPLPLYNPDKTLNELNNILGLNFSISGHGFGFGATYERDLTNNLAISGNIMISGAKNTDEFEQWDYDRGEYRVPNKINRLILIPITLGAKYYILTSLLSENFKPFLMANVGASWIIATPYDREFFNAFHHSQSYMRFTGVIGVGSDFGIGKSVLRVNLKQYFIPFGGEGLESVSGHPLTDFGGFQIDLMLGMRY